MEDKNTTPLDKVTREEMISVIYEEIADKTLSFWCRYTDNVWYDHKFAKEYDTFYFSILPNWNTYNLQKNKIKKTIGHQVMIWDVMDWDMNRYYVSMEYSDESYSNNSYLLTERWREKRKPINEQSDVCVKFVYELCKQP